MNPISKLQAARRDVGLGDFTYAIGVLVRGGFPSDTDSPQTDEKRYDIV